jgi:DNA-binding MarR family transcriptional regulator
MDTDRVISLISKLRRDSSAFIEREMAGAGMDGVIASHGAIIGALFRSGGELKMKDIAEKIARDKSTVTYLIDGLVKSGYVIRKKGEDSRETYISLTDKAWRIQGRIKEISEKLIAAAYRGFSEEEKRTLMALLEKMDANFRPE